MTTVSEINKYAAWTTNYDLKDIATAASVGKFFLWLIKAKDADKCVIKEDGSIVIGDGWTVLEGKDMPAEFFIWLVEGGFISNPNVDTATRLLQDKLNRDEFILKNIFKHSLSVKITAHSTQTIVELQEKDTKECVWVGSSFELLQLVCA
ncbi:MAG: hypothetical protein ACXAEU_21035 [Candidatus Hodarchaeales archaeon]|jgi:hypothetical protein